MTDHRNMKPPALWRKEPDEVSLLLLGKLAEEANELAAVPAVPSAALSRAWMLCPAIGF